MTPQEIIEKILKSRGIRDFERYFNPKPKYLEKSTNLVSIDQARLIVEKLKQSRLILLYSDYDVDGVTSSAVFSRFLNDVGIKNYKVVIPDRFKDGYGLNLEKIKKEFKSNPFDMLITFDCGIGSVDEVEYLKQLGVFVVITDHHLPQDKIPSADIVINPKLSSTEEKGDYHLCGCGVVFKLIHVLKVLWGLDSVDLKKYLEHVAIATVADIVPLIGDNRILVKNGLEVINETPSEGVKALINVSGLKSALNSYHIGFIIGPRINASGRLDIADTSYYLLMQNCEDTAAKYAKILEEINQARKKECDEIFKEALCLIPQIPKYGICLYKSSWNKGVIGIVASRLVERFNLPTIIFGTSVGRKDDGGIISGSGRSTDDLNLHELLVEIDRQYPGLMIRYGGHVKACGLSIYEEDFEVFVEAYTGILQDLNIDNRKKICYDMELSFADINFELIDYIKKMEPFGYGNEMPKFLFTNVEVIDFRKMGDGNHYSINLRQDGRTIRGVWFNGDEQKITDKLNIIGVPIINEYNNNRYLQIRIRDIV
ncbi:single-stranded-DNA-specific exonuclease RecJ [Calditerrivibrio sp.]|uniref:single-stranded-DNA-specific exonuclease RecJ n=1 Tax=Calditerrivibrio sp. TaxID=2792612 RepID=UPI003D10498F